MSYEAVHQTILVVDIEGFGKLDRTDPIRAKLRADLSRLLEEAFKRGSVDLSQCTPSDTGDGVLVLIPAGVPKTRVLDCIVFLARDLRERNDSASDKAKMRLRAVVHAGEVACGDNVGRDLNYAFRLLDCKPLRAALAKSSADLALIVSDLIYEGVVGHNAGLIAPTEFDEVEVRVKEVKTTAWITVRSRGKGGTGKHTTDASPDPAPGSSAQELPRRVGMIFNAPPTFGGDAVAGDKHVTNRGRA
ncbi:MAG: hypothetical protein ACRDZ4_17615 [Egibacteraceae bacterium]